MATTYECWTVDDIPLDTDEVVRGYRDGRKDEPEPGPNHAPAYRHGWWTGQSDRHPERTPPWVPVLARLIARGDRA